MKALRRIEGLEVAEVAGAKPRMARLPPKKRKRNRGKFTKFRQYVKRPRISIWYIVRTYLEGLQKVGEIQRADFDEVSRLVSKVYPRTAFSPKHLAWYKHHFLRTL